MTTIKFRIDDVKVKGPIGLDKLTEIAKLHGINYYWALDKDRKQLTREVLESYTGDIYIEPIGYFNSMK